MHFVCFISRRRFVTSLRDAYYVMSDSTVMARLSVFDWWRHLVSGSNACQCLKGGPAGSDTV